MFSKYCLLAALLPFAAAAGVNCSYPAPAARDALAVEIRNAQAAYMTSAPVIDGKLDDAVWQQADQLQDFVWLRRLGVQKLQSWAEKEVKERARIPVTQTTMVKVGYDQDNLYVAFDCKEARMNELRAKEADRSLYVWMDDCVEVMLQTPQQDKNKYYHFVVTAGNATTSSLNDLKAVSQLDVTFDRAVQINPDGWTAEIQIPFAILEQETPADGTLYRVNFCREEHPFSEISSWNETQITFNEPQNFGRLIFGRNTNPEIACINWNSPARGQNRLSAELFNPAAEALDVTLELQLNGKIIAERDLQLPPKAYTTAELDYVLENIENSLELSIGSETKSFTTSPGELTGQLESAELLNPATVILGDLSLPIGNTESGNVRLIWQVDGKEIDVTKGLQDRKIRFEAELPELEIGAHILSVIMQRNDEPEEMLELPFTIIPGMFDEF